MISWRSAAAFGAAVALCACTSAPALAADTPLSLKQAKSAATKQAGAKGRARYPFDTFTVSVRACKREARFKATCQASIRGVAGCLENQCAPLSPGLYRETCSWTSIITASGPRHRRLRAGSSGFKCELGAALPDA